MAIELLTIIVVVFVWLLSLTVFLVRQHSTLKKFLGKDNRNALDVLEDFDARLDKALKQVDQHALNFEKLSKTLEGHIQKLGLVKFNPFEETGGDYSFSMALLDGKNNGVVITGLHARQRTRIYIKEIVNGKSNLKLSKEEILAIKKAEPANEK